MAKKIILPAKITIGFDYKDGQVAIVRFDVKYRSVLDEYPEFPMLAQSKQIQVTEAQANQIRQFCKDVILPQIN